MSTQALGGAGRLFRILGHTARHCPAALPLARATTQQPRHFVALLRYCAPSLMQARAASGAAGSAGDALDASDWAKLGAYLKDYDDKRETLIKRTREIQKLSKQAIFSLHRGDAQRAAAQLRDAGQLPSIALGSRVSKHTRPILSSQDTLLPLASSCGFICMPETPPKLVLCLIQWFPLNSQKPYRTSFCR